jgi:hypothetical protein
MRPIQRRPFVEETLPVEGRPDVPAPPKAAHQSAKWTVAQLMKDLASCDGGTGVLAKAKAANGGKAPVFKVGASVIGTGGSTDTDAGVITMDPNQDRATAAETAIVELTNLSNKARFAQVDADVAAGKLGREQYTRANEAIEYDAVRNAIKADNACKKQWGAPPGWAGSYDALAKVKSFDEYYRKYLSASHKNYYRQAWDKNYKAIYNAAHPPHKHP